MGHPQWQGGRRREDRCELESTSAPFEEHKECATRPNIFFALRNDRYALGTLENPSLDVLGQ